MLAEIRGERVLRIEEVERMVGLRKSAIYTRVNDSTFPRPIKLTTRSSGWLLSEVQGWIAERAAARDTVT